MSTRNDPDEDRDAWREYEEWLDDIEPSQLRPLPLEPARIQHIPDPPIADEVTDGEEQP